MYGPAVSSPLSKSAPAAIDRKPGRASIARPTISRYPADRKNRAAIAVTIVGRSRLTSFLLASFPLLWPFARMGEQPIQAEIHGRHAVMIGPTAGQCYESPGASPRLSIKPRDVVIQLGVIGFRQRGRAEVKGSFDGCHQLVLAFRSLQFLRLWARHIADIRAEKVIAIGNVGGEMAECHLLGGGLIVELVGRHFLDGA